MVNTGFFCLGPSHQETLKFQILPRNDDAAEYSLQILVLYIVICKSTFDFI